MRPCTTIQRVLRVSVLLGGTLSGTLGGTTAPDEKFIPPNIQESGRIGCFVEADDGTHEYADAKVFTQYAVPNKPDWIAVMSRRGDAKQLFLDCATWFREMAEAFPKSKEKK